MNKVHIVGVGPGAPQYLTRGAEEAIREFSEEGPAAAEVSNPG